MNTQKVGESLKNLRNNLVFTLQDVSKLSGIPVPTISDYENANIQNINLTKLESICRIYGVSVSALLSSVEKNKGIHFRASELKLSSKTEKQVDELVNLADDYHNISNLLGDDRSPSYKRTYPNSPNINWFKLGNDIAQEERRLLGLSFDKGINLVPILERNEVLVICADLAPDIEGFFYAQTNSTNFSIFINANSPYNRQNFSLAHEYVHFLLDRENSYICSEKNKNETIEQRANAIAARILVPKCFLKKYKNQKITPDIIIEICKEFLVSSKTAIFRLDDEGFITKAEKKELTECSYTTKTEYRVISDLLEENFKKFKIDIEFCDLNPWQENYICLVKKAYDLGKITYKRALKYIRNKELAEKYEIYPKDSEEAEIVF